MEGWLEHLRHDPIPALLSSKSEAVRFSAKRDILDQNVGQLDHLWGLPEVNRILSGQLPNGAWKYHSVVRERLRAKEDYNQLETYRIMGDLVEKYSLNRKHEAIAKTASYLFSCQTDEGDFRGIYGRQYTPNYTAGIMELLIKAGYQADSRIENGFTWLRSIRQNDGGWAVPARTVGRQSITASMKGPTNMPDRTKPYSHLVTGVVLRAYAAHQEHRNSEDAKIAGRLLASRFFQEDRYPDRQAAAFWTKFSYPFWFTDLLSSLDSLSLIGFGANNPLVKSGFDWLVSNQQADGAWKLTMLRTKDKNLSQWIGLAICRVFKRFYR